MSTILITGAGRGLGLELARQYAASGWKVIGTVRDAAGASRLKQIGAEAFTVDITDFTKVKAAAEKLKGVAIDVLFCNAGIIGKRGNGFGQFDYADWEEIFRVNVIGAAAVIEALAENVAASERKVIAVMSSRLGSIAEAGGVTVPYSTTKTALNMLAKSLSEILKARGIVVVALSPGWVKTDMGGDSAPLDAEASVRGLRQVIDGLKPRDSGKFLAYDGSAIDW